MAQEKGKKRAPALTPDALGVVDAYVSVPAAGRLLSCARQTVFKMLAVGTLKGQLVAGRFVVERSSIDAYLANHRNGHSAE